MARSSTGDPIEKFRFKVFVFPNTASILVNTIATAAGQSIDNSSNFITAGFTDIVLPKMNITEINYRENTNNYSFRKIAGLTRYEPIVFKKGVIRSKELFDWIKIVNDESSALNFVSNNILNTLNVLSYQDAEYRRDLVILTLDRSGDVVKSWYIAEAFPISYKGGDDLNSSSNEKLLEELTLTYEWFYESNVNGQANAVLDDVSKAATAAALKAIEAATVSLAAGAIGSLF